jgi:16S rRNA (guanine527-N7)-methyltransferase
MDTARISPLLEPYLEESLTESQLEQISIYIDLLQRWNARINLTAIHTEAEIVTRHFGESFFMARHLFPPKNVARTLLSANARNAQQPDHLQLSNPCHPERSSVIREADDAAESKDPYSTSQPKPPQVLDIGSGAGFPAIPLKIWSPEIHLTLIESNHKKSAFLSEVARALKFTDINIIVDRAEAVAKNPDFPRTEIVTFRAVERFDSALRQAATLLAEDGKLALLISAAQLPFRLPLRSLMWRPPIPVPNSQRRVLAIGVLRESGKWSGYFPAPTD